MWGTQNPGLRIERVGSIPNLGTNSKRLTGTCLSPDSLFCPNFAPENACKSNYCKMPPKIISEDLTFFDEFRVAARKPGNVTLTGTVSLRKIACGIWQRENVI
jgi:hypothetical protein